MTSEWIVFVVFVVAGLLGIRATWRLWRLFTFDSESRQQLLLFALAVVATVITAAAVFYGIAAAFRIAGVTLPPGTPFVSIALASAVLLIPAFLEWVVGRIAKRAALEEVASLTEEAKP